MLLLARLLVNAGSYFPHIASAFKSSTGPVVSCKPGVTLHLADGRYEVGQWLSIKGCINSEVNHHRRFAHYLT